MKLEIEISDEDAALIAKLLEAIKPEADEWGPPCNSHGEIDTPEKLLAMLAEDCALAVRRPGSWEGANMLNVLASHGYSV